MQRIFESNFSIIVFTHFCSLTGMMLVDVSNVGGVGFVQEVYYKRQDVCNLYGDVGWLWHYLSGPARCNIWELNRAVHSKMYIEEIRFLLVGNNMCSVTLSPVICRDPSTTGNQVMAIIAIMLMIFQSTSKIRAVIYLQTILHLGYSGTHEINCRAFLVRWCLDPWQKGYQCK